MRFGDIIGFREDLFFEGAVQIDWFHNQLKASKVASSYVFHGKDYFGVSDEPTGHKLTDTVTFFKIIAEKIEDEHRGNPFTLAISEYGTGKSHLALTLAQVLSGKDYMPDTYNKIIDNIRRIDLDAAKKIETARERPNLVLTINGMHNFNLHYELLRSASKSLKLYGYSDENLKKLNRAHEIAFRFLERNIESNILLFEQKALNFNWSEKGLELANKLRRTLSEDDITFEIINGVYEDINGHEIRWDEGISANSILETLLTEYCGISGPFNKIIIIFDEFGRYLEFASSVNTVQSGDSALQHIFEAVQNADGSIQMINFIQSDIKAYLQRIDKTRNISRYIGRYDASDKYHLSSNLETVFANLIDRKDKRSFENYIKCWLKRKEATWIDIYSKMDKWLPLKGIWKDRDLFERVIVEGIYPLHPISTYMLTGLSGYLQNRSSLTLVSNKLSVLSSYVLSENQECPLIMPEQLLEGDLYSEMLTAEQEGRQLSRHCIRFDNILRKLGDKISENMGKVLRANLVLKLLRFKTSNYEEAKQALSICSGLSISSVEQELVWLENEYAVLGFDEHTGSFDFLEDSSGAHDFRTFYRRVKAGKTLSMSVFEDSYIRELAGVLTPINTNFSFENRIKSNEWQFTQDLFHIAEISEAYIDSLIADFRNSTSPEKIKGRLIWLYMSKDTEDNALIIVQKLSLKLVGIPIVMFLLNDAENKLYSALLDYEVLANSISSEEKNKFGRHYTDALLQAENNIKDTFIMLQRERLMIHPDKVISLENRLAISLSDILKKIYPQIVSFDFDGFDSKQPGRAKKSYCSILKLLLSGCINANTIQSSPVEVRNRFEATLFESGKNSWKCVNLNYQIIPPKDTKVLSIYSYLEQKLKNDKQLNCKDIFSELSIPPYGLNDYIIVYLISVFCANLSYCIKPVYKKETYSVVKWKDLVVGDNKVEIGMIKETCFILVDAGAVIDNYIRIFNKVENNDNIFIVNDYLEELQQLVRSEEVPLELEAQYKLCEYRLNEGTKILTNWNKKIDDIINKYETAVENADVYLGLQTIKLIENIGISSIFSGNYVMPESAKEQLKDIKNKLKAFVEPKLITWIKSQRCYSVESMSQYEKHYKRISSLLKDLCYFNEANFAEKHGETELQNREMIRERQELKEKCNRFLSENVVTQFIAYTTLFEWEKQGTELLMSIEKHKEFLDLDYTSLTNKITARVNEIIKSHKKIKADMDDIWDDMYELPNVDMTESIIERIDYVCKKGIPGSDQADFIELKRVLEVFLSDVKELEAFSLDRERFERECNALYKKYSEDVLDIDVIHILNNIAETTKGKMNAEENEWIKTYILPATTEISRQQALEWLEKTIVIPSYISNDTKNKYLNMKERIEQILSDANIEDVIFHFKKLNKSEREKCMRILLAMCSESQ